MPTNNSQASQVYLQEALLDIHKLKVDIHKLKVDIHMEDTLMVQAQVDLQVVDFHKVDPQLQLDHTHTHMGELQVDLLLEEVDLLLEELNNNKLSKNTCE
jgi:hypothetical protein